MQKNIMHSEHLFEQY